MKTNTTKPNRQLTDPFSQVAGRFEAWRATRRRGHAIPEELWRAAAQLAREHGLNPTASALKLNYYALQRRLAQPSAPSSPAPAPTRPTFVELRPPVPEIPRADTRTLELSRPDGARLSLRLLSLEGRDLCSLVQSFLGS